MLAVDPTEVLKVGGSGHKVILLIEGKAHAYIFPSPGTKKWDTCAPEAILHALGGKVDIIRNYGTIFSLFGTMRLYDLYYHYIFILLIVVFII